jgi:hypothetical protein
MKYKPENDLTVEQLIKVYEESEEIVGDVK